MKKLTGSQVSTLESLRRSASQRWKYGAANGWTWSTPSGTERVLKALVTKGLVKYDDDGAFVPFDTSRPEIVELMPCPTEGCGAFFTGSAEGIYRYGHCGHGIRRPESCDLRIYIVRVEHDGTWKAEFTPIGPLLSMTAAESALRIGRVLRGRLI